MMAVGYFYFIEHKSNDPTEKQERLMSIKEQYDKGTS